MAFVSPATTESRSGGLRTIAKGLPGDSDLLQLQNLKALEHGMPGYQLYFVRKWMRSLLKKQAVWPGDYDFRELGRLADLRRMVRNFIVNLDLAVTEHGQAGSFLESDGQKTLIG